MATFVPRMNEDDRLTERQAPIGQGIGGVTIPPPSIGGTGTPTPVPTPAPPTPTPTPAPTTGGIGGATVPPPTTGTGTGTGATTPPKPTTSGFNSAGNYTPQNDSVIDAVNQVVTSNSPLMQRAQGIGMAVANARGLQNSSLAAQSAEKAMLDAAVPIASQQAQQTYGKNLQFMQAQTQKQLEQMQVDSNMSVAQLQTAAQTQSAFSAALLAASQSYQANVSAIMQNPDLSAAARQAALDSASKQRDSDFQMIQKVYGVNVSAPPTSTTGTTGGAGSTASSGIGANDNLTWGAFPARTAA